jgi:hypothetical protein
MTSTTNSNNQYTQEQLDLINNALTIQQCKDQQASIGIKAKWWGYTVELNQKAVTILDKCLDYLEDELGHHFKGEIRRAISFCIQLKQHRLEKAVGHDGYVRMISPWIMPFALTVVRGASSGDDQSLWFTVWDPDQRTWGEDAEFHDCFSRNAPALAQHGDLLYCVHRGADSDDRLWWTVYSTNDGWSDDTVFPNHHTASNTSLVEFKGTLYCFHRGTGSDEKLYYCTFDTERRTWNNDIVIKVGTQEYFSYTGCAVAVFNDELHLVYQVRPSNGFYHLIFDGTAWRNAPNNPQGLTADTPALVAYGTSLLLVHRGYKDEDMWYGTYDGHSWSQDKQIPNTCSDMGPGLAVFGEEVFMVHRSSGRDGALWYSTYNNGSGWSKDTHVDNVCTGAPPAIACYTDPQCNPDNYTDSTTAVPRLICVHRGWGK